MTCKDCLHFEVCEAVRGRSNRVGRNSLRVSEKHCPYNSFKDKSEWIHLPYKVGDIVYCFAPCFDTDHHPKLKVIEKEIIELKTMATVLGLNFDIHDIGKTIFSTREEAKKALKDMRNKNFYADHPTEKGGATDTNVGGKKKGGDEE